MKKEDLAQRRRGTEEEEFYHEHRIVEPSVRDTPRTKRTKKGQGESPALKKYLIPFLFPFFLIASVMSPVCRRK